MCVKTTAELFFYHSVVFITGVVAWQRTESGKKSNKQQRTTTHILHFHTFIENNRTVC